MASPTLSSRNNGSQPAKAEIARERTLPSISGKNKTRGNCDAKNISINDRIQQYPGEELSIKDGKLFCDEKCNLKSEKCNILYLKYPRKSEHFYVTHRYFFKKIALF